MKRIELDKTLEPLDQSNFIEGSSPTKLPEPHTEPADHKI